MGLKQFVIRSFDRNRLIYCSELLRFFCRVLTSRRSLNLRTEYMIRVLNTASLRQNITSDDLGLRLNFAEEFQSLLLQPLAQSKLVRLGRNADGGYSIPPLKFDKLVTLGVGKDISFEMNSFFQEVDIHLFDHTVERPFDLNKNMMFYKKGIGNSDKDNLLSFNSICELSQVNSNAKNLLKFDIEGDEYFVFENADFSKFSTIVCELHWIEDCFYSDKFFNLQILLMKLHLNHSLVNVHVNNWSSLFNVGSVVLPNVVQLTFLKSKELNQQGKTSSIESIDFPCRVGYPEIWPPKLARF